MNWWTHPVADVADWFPGGLYGLALTVLLLGVAVGLLLQPFGLYRVDRKPRKSGKPKAATEIIAAEPAAEEALPDLPADQLLARAQHYMDTGDYRLAVREWLRVAVRDLVDRAVIEHRPGWTVTELARGAGQALPPVAADLDEAARVFSDIWYGGRDADLTAANRMRDLHLAVTGAAAAQPPIATVTVEAP